jgi:glucan phosphoethanolaminetransferase (alkaline phosphatase superfamily)
MIKFLSIILVIVYAVIALIHFYWLFGEKWLDKALPTDENGKRVLNPRKFETIIVTLGLLLFAFYYLLKIELFEVEVPKLITKYSGWIISTIFIIRAIGDFKYVGFFKKIKNTKFAEFDTKYFTFISLIIGLIGIIIELI